MAAKCLAEREQGRACSQCLKHLHLTTVPIVHIKDLVAIATITQGGRVETLANDTIQLSIICSITYLYAPHIPTTSSALSPSVTSAPRCTTWKRQVDLTSTT